MSTSVWDWLTQHNQESLGAITGTKGDPAGRAWSAFVLESERKEAFFIIIIYFLCNWAVQF